MSAGAAAAYDAWYATPLGPLGAAFVAARGERRPALADPSRPAGPTVAPATSEKEPHTP